MVFNSTYFMWKSTCSLNLIICAYIGSNTTVCNAMEDFSLFLIVLIRFLGINSDLNLLPANFIQTQSGLWLGHLKTILFI